MAGKEITALISGSYPDGNLEPVRKASTQNKDIKTTGATDTSRFIFKPSETRIKQVMQTAIILVAAYMATTLELPRPQSLLLDSG